MQLGPSQGPGGPHSLAGVLLNRAQRAQRLPQDSPDYEVNPPPPPELDRLLLACSSLPLQAQPQDPAHWASGTGRHAARKLQPVFVICSTIALASG